MLCDGVDVSVDDTMVLGGTIVLLLDVLAGIVLVVITVAVMVLVVKTVIVLDCCTSTVVLDVMKVVVDARCAVVVVLGNTR